MKISPIQDRLDFIERNLDKNKEKNIIIDL